VEETASTPDESSSEEPLAQDIVKGDETPASTEELETIEEASPSEGQEPSPEAVVETSEAEEPSSDGSESTPAVNENLAIVEEQVILIEEESPPSEVSQKMRHLGILS